MKTTFDLPQDLILEMKLRALHEGRKLKDIAAELLRSALRPDSTEIPKTKSTKLVPKTLPTLKTDLPLRKAPAMTPQDFSQFIKQADADLDAKTSGH